MVLAQQFKKPCEGGGRRICDQLVYNCTEAHRLWRTSQKHGREELPHVRGQGLWQRGATSRPKLGEAAETSNPTSKEQRLRRHICLWWLCWISWPKAPAKGVKYNWFSSTLRLALVQLFSQETSIISFLSAERSWFLPIAPRRIFEQNV